MIMVVGSVELGDFAHVAQSCVRKICRDAKGIDQRILFLTYAGMDEQKLQYLQELMQQHCAFERVDLPKASFVIVSNCGPGSFGLLFMRKNDAILSLSQASKNNEPEEALAGTSGHENSKRSR